MILGVYLGHGTFPSVFGSFTFLPISFWERSYVPKLRNLRKKVVHLESKIAGKSVRVVTVLFAMAWQEDTINVANVEGKGTAVRGQRISALTNIRQNNGTRSRDDGTGV